MSIVAFDLSGLTRLERLEVASGMSEALLFPRSLEKLSIRDAASALSSSAIESNRDMEECIGLEGPALQRLLRM